eukprot:g16865.t1
MGCAKFGERWDADADALMVEAFEEAIADAGIEVSQLDAAWLGVGFDAQNVGPSGIPASIALRLPDIGVTKVENYCASGTESLRGAVYAVASGAADIALAIGVEKLKDTGYGGLPMRTRGTRWDMIGVTGSAPGNFAQLASAYRAKHGVDQKDLKTAMAHVSVKSHDNGSKNPKAHLRNKIDIDKALNAPMIAEPLGLYDCCGVSDGSACAIVTTPEIAKSLGKTDIVTIKAMQIVSSSGWELQGNEWDGSYFHTTRVAAKRAYEEAGVTNPSEQVSLTEVHDCFSITELVTMEDLFISEEGQAWKDVLDGKFDADGQLGAEVIRVDTIGGGPDYKRWPKSDEGDSFYWEGLNKGKKSITINLRADEGRELLRSLVAAPGAQSGVLLTNFPQKGFLSYENLKSAREDVIVARVMGQANGGPALDYTVNCALGYPMMTGPESMGDEPVNHVLPAWDLLAGAYTAFSVLAAEKHRTATGEGGEYKIPLSDIGITAAANMGQIAEVLYQDGNRARYGNELFGAFGKDFQTADGKRMMIMAITTRQWLGLLKVLDIEAEVTQIEAERGVTLAKDEGIRFEHRDVIYPLVESRVAKWQADDLQAALDENEIIRPSDFGLQTAAAKLAEAPSVSALLSEGNTPEKRRALAEFCRDGRYAYEEFGDDFIDAARDQYRTFTEERIVPYAHEWHLENALIPDETVAELAELGTFGICIPEEFDGLGQGKLLMSVVTEELSRGWISAGSLGTRSEIAGELILLGGTPEQQQQWLPGIASGEILPTAVFTEPNVGSDMGSLATRAVETDDGWLIKGNKTWITHASRSDLMTLMARSKPDEKGYAGLSMFLVPKQRGDDDNLFPDEGLEGTEIEVLGYRGMREYELGFDDFPLPKDALLGGEQGKGFKQLMETFEGARIQTAARAVGIARRALELGLEYSLQRNQFQKPIFEFPRVSDKIAMMAVDILVSRELTYFAAREKDKGHRCDIEAGMAKLVAAQAAWANADASLQIHGGNGYALEYEISRVLCDARIMNIFEGAGEIQAQVIARGKLSPRK